MIKSCWKCGTHENVKVKMIKKYPDVFGSQKMKIHICEECHKKEKELMAVDL
jgi:hypothetical protein